MKNYDLIIVGGGSAGMAAAIQARNDGIDSILILEREERLGGILNQCIHNGFGLTEFKEELSGPEYLQRFVDQVEELNIEYKVNSFVLDVSKDKVVKYSNQEDGVTLVQGKAVIFATGCFERSAGAISLPGDRVAGIITAGTAQRYLNINGYMVGKKIVILGSGDIGLIMARRLTLEGAKVLCVSEIMPYSNGLNRNIAQCLTDFNIPLYLSHSVLRVEGKSRVEKVVLCQVDEKMNFIPGTEKEFECDTLILSVGLIPYIKQAKRMGVQTVNDRTILVNQHLETSIPGVFMCGNCLHVHDVVDFVTEEGREAGHAASLYIKDTLSEYLDISVKAEHGISYVIPQKVCAIPTKSITFKFRVKKPVRDVFVVFSSGEKELARYYKMALIPSEMVMIKVPVEKLTSIENDITVSLEEK